MLRKCLLLALALVLSFGSLSCAPTKVVFPDAMLEAAIREAIKKPEGPIYRADLKELTFLPAAERYIRDLTGLRYSTNLTKLWLGGNQISDISPLASLTNLTELAIQDNQISDISSLASLTSLTRIGLGGNQISDISPLASLTNLTVLSLGGNQISDISSLASLTNLSELLLQENQISDIKPLVDNSGLAAGDTVDLRYNPLSTTSMNVYIPQLLQRGVVVLVYL